MGALYQNDSNIMVSSFSTHYITLGLIQYHMIKISGQKKKVKICFAPSSILRTPIRSDLIIWRNASKMTMSWTKYNIRRLSLQYKVYYMDAFNPYKHGTVMYDAKFPFKIFLGTTVDYKKVFRLWPGNIFMSITWFVLISPILWCN